jgi:hypothetical protein
MKERYLCILNTFCRMVEIFLKVSLQYKPIIRFNPSREITGVALIFILSNLIL